MSGTCLRHAEVNLNRSVVITGDHDDFKLSRKGGRGGEHAQFQKKPWVRVSLRALGPIGCNKKEKKKKRGKKQGAV